MFFLVCLMFLFVLYYGIFDIVFGILYEDVIWNLYYFYVLFSALGLQNFYTILALYVFILVHLE